ncbi:Actin-related protein 10 [Balamuthia mandrillaris]
MSQPASTDGSDSPTSSSAPASPALTEGRLTSFTPVSSPLLAGSIDTGVSPIPDKQPATADSGSGSTSSSSSLLARTLKRQSSSLASFPTTGPAAIVVEVGSANFKCGFAGEAQPRYVIPTEWRSHTGVDLGPSLEGSLKGPRYGPEEWEEAAFFMLHNVYYQYLQTNPQDRPIILCENILLPQVVRTALVKVLFTRLQVCIFPPLTFTCRHLSLSSLSLISLSLSHLSHRHLKQVPSVHMVVGMCMAMLPPNLATALIVDCGYTETTVLPVYEGLVQTHALRTTPVAGKYLNNTLKALLKEKVSEESLLSREVIEDIKIRHCRVLPSSPISSMQEDKEEESKDELVVSYAVSSLPEDTIRIPQRCLDEATEVLFEGGLADKEEGAMREIASVAATLLDSLSRCGHDTRCSLAQNILLTGNTALLPGFASRLLNDIHLLFGQGHYSSLRGIEDQFFIVDSMFPPSLLSWMGASVVGCVEHKEAITKTQYLEEGEPLPDWTSLRQLSALADTNKPQRSMKKDGTLTGGTYGGGGPFQLTPLLTTTSSSSLSSYLSASSSIKRI